MRKISQRMRLSHPRLQLSLCPKHQLQLQENLLQELQVLLKMPLNQPRKLLRPSQPKVALKQMMLIRRKAYFLQKTVQTLKEKVVKHKKLLARPSQNLELKLYLGLSKSLSRIIS
ncbi:unnamed protein product [Acanthoscelides obtectus]|uniref:Uncharacterized protein n=1 Tax=Acanthoscelides obtectus TaxID=200917 RepID=A0A9P0JNL8_ACAOB|nr:unnamed protein product [Acanthoscelides obtectus]CAK1625809.1 hypothetical protein AOBTE_LOCUS3413 [Acanthoscelides obtectus]